MRVISALNVVSIFKVNMQSTNQNISSLKCNIGPYTSTRKKGRLIEIKVRLELYEVEKLD